MWVKKYFTSGEHGWKCLFENALTASDLNAKLIFFCNFDINRWNVKPLLSTFYQQVLCEWSKSNNSSIFDKNQIIWYNRNKLVQEQSVFYQDFFDAGIKFISDLYDDNSIIPFTQLQNRGLNNKHYMKWRGLLSSITKNIPKVAINIETNSAVFETLETETLTYNNHSLKALTSRMAYDYILTIKCGTNVYIPRITKYADLENVDWTICFKNAQNIPIDTKTREFEFKFLHDVLVNIFWLKKWSLAATDECSFCKTSSETILHLFWHCECSQTFWADFNHVYAERINIIVDVYTVVCGNEDPLIYTLLCIAKRHIYECKHAEKKPDIRIYKHKVNFIKETEFEIAKRNDTVLRYAEKWEPLSLS